MDLWRSGSVCVPVQSVFQVFRRVEGQGYAQDTQVLQLQLWQTNFEFILFICLSVCLNHILPVQSFPGGSTKKKDGKNKEKLDRLQKIRNVFSNKKKTVERINE